MFSTVFIILFWTAFGLITYTYILFPLILAGMARAFGKREASASDSMPDEMLPRVAMIVAAYNEEGVLCEKLANTWAIDYPADRFEIWIGSDGSDDGTPAILQACNDSRLRCRLYTERRGKISVLNDLMSEVNADIVVMSDANTMFAPDAVRKLAAHFVDSQVGCVSGELSLMQNGGVSGEGFYWKYENWIKRSEDRLGFLIGCNGAIFALRPKCFEPLPTSTLVEDFVLTMRILEQGYKVRFEPEARAYEPPCASSRAEMVRKVRIGAGGFQSIGLTKSLLHPRFGLRAFAYWGHKVMRWCVPFFIVVLFASTIALATRNFYQACLAVQVLGLLVSLWTYNVSPGKKMPGPVRLISYFYLMNYALWCGFWRFIFRTQRVTWQRAAQAHHLPAAEYEFAAASADEPASGYRSVGSENRSR